MSKKETRTIMLQGTASGVGKSTLAIGLCRLFVRRGWKTAPFKAQNLSDNAYVFPDGRQMAASQAMAAAACGLAPTPDMNPVLLKPYHGGCQVFVHGLETKRFDRALCRQAVRDAYGRLCQEVQVVVAEGAGSPVEMNLKDTDIVNMAFAREADCPVILVADIRRGGVFAALYGTISLLPLEERRLVRGMIVNDFYGDPKSFGEGRRILEELCGVPVLGVVPHLALQLEDEDNLPGENTMTREKIAALIPKGMTAADFQTQQFDALADALENCLNMKALEQILEGKDA